MSCRPTPTIARLMIPRSLNDNISSKAFFPRFPNGTDGFNLDSITSAIKQKASENNFGINFPPTVSRPKKIGFTKANIIDFSYVFRIYKPIIVS